MVMYLWCFLRVIDVNVLYYQFFLIKVILYIYIGLDIENWQDLQSSGCLGMWC